MILNKLCILILGNAGNGQVFMVYGDRQSYPCSLRPDLFTNQLAIENRICESIVECNQQHSLFSQKLRGMVGQARPFGIIGLFGIGILPMSTPTGVDVQHVARQQPAPSKSLFFDHGFDVPGRKSLARRHCSPAAQTAFGVQEHGAGYAIRKFCIASKRWLSILRKARSIYSHGP